MDDTQGVQKVLDIIENGFVVNKLSFLSIHLAFIMIVMKIILLETYV